MLTLVSQRNRFEPSSERGNFLNLAKYGDIPSSHGDIPVVFCLIHVIELKSTLNRVLSKFLPALGALFWLLQVSKMQVLLLVRSLSSDSLSKRKLILFWEATKFICEATSYLPFPVCSVSKHQHFSKPITFKNT